MTLTVQEVKVRLLDKGSGTPSLFLHGNPDTADMWGDLIEALSPHVRCLAPDLPGFGQSIAPPDFNCSLDNLAEYIDALVQAMGVVEPLNLIVHDIGGHYGLAWAAKYPRKVKRIVIFNTFFSPDFEWTLLHRIWRTPMIGELSQLLMNRRAFTRELSRGASKLTVAQINRIYDRITPAMKKMALRYFRTNALSEFKSWQKRLDDVVCQIPSMVLWSDDDPYISSCYADRFGTRNVVHLPGYGHWLPIEAHDEVKSHLLRFLCQ